MKRVLKGMLALAFAAVFCMVFFAGCEDMGESSVWGGESAYSDVDVTDPIYGFIKEEDYDPETFDLENATQWTTFDVDTEYFAVINFVVTSRKDNAGQGLLNVQISFDKLDVLHGTVEDVNTGIVSELPAPPSRRPTSLSRSPREVPHPRRSTSS